MINSIHIKVLDEIIYQFQNFSCVAVEALEMDK